MPRRKHTPDQIVRKLREGEKLLGEGKDLAEVCKTSRSPSRAGIGGETNTAA